MSRAGTGILAFVVCIRLLFHALYVPAFEGPDEPFHLARALIVARDLPRAFEKAQVVPQEVAREVSANPCCPDLQRVFGCAPFEHSGAFNGLSPARRAAKSPSVENYEAHQPPVYYLVSGAVVATVGLVGVHSAIGQALALRIASIMFVLAGVLAIRSTGDAGRRPTTLLLCALLIPGASESLVRVANDSLVFLFTSLILFALQRRAWPLLLLACACAPMTKLTALPIIAVAVARLWTEGHRRVALGAGAASLLVVPVQAIRGWAWGGTVELNQSSMFIDEGLRTVLVGLLRSLYTIAKTAFWLGNWSFFRAPTAFVAVVFAFLVLALASSRLIADRRTVTVNLFGFAVLAAGVLAFSLAHRSLFGHWGGVGGWYLWGLAPWIVVALSDCLEIRTRWQTPALLAGIALLAVSNALWMFRAATLYGWG